MYVSNNAYTTRGDKMSLNWNAQSVANIDARLEDKADANAIAYFAFALMAIGIGSVSKKNVGEVFTRIKIWENLNGPIHYEDKQLEDGTWSNESAYNFGFVMSMVGYGTNVSTETLSSWSKKVLARAAERYQKQFEEKSVDVAEPAVVEPLVAYMPS
jgi:hypothetical protein